AADHVSTARVNNRIQRASLRRFGNELFGENAECIETQLRAMNKFSIVTLKPLSECGQRGKRTCTTNKCRGLAYRNNLFHLGHTLCDVVRSDLYLSFRRRFCRLHTLGHAHAAYT